MRTRQTFLAVSSVDDPAVQLVRDQVETSGSRLLLLPTDGLIGTTGLSSEFSDTTRPSQQFASISETVDFSEIDAIWLRRIRFHAPIASSWTPDYRRAVQKQTYEALAGVLTTSQLPVLDPVAPHMEASNKLVQLQRALHVGLRIPHTIVTSDPEAARHFLRRVQGPTVAKPVTTLIVDTGDGVTAGMYTTILQDADFDAFDDLRWCPLILQVAIPKAADIRATVVGDRVFAAMLKTRSDSPMESDWRRIAA